MQPLSTEQIDHIWNYFLKLAKPDGSFGASWQDGYLGIADSRVSDMAAAVYAAEIAMTLGRELPYPEKTIAFIKSHQDPTEGYFQTRDRPEIDPVPYRIYHICIACRGLKALDATPDYDPCKFMTDYVAQTPIDKMYPYCPDMIANAYVALGKTMPDDCRDKLIEFILSTQDPATGWIIQRSNDPTPRPYARNNPITFHSARFYELVGQRIPMADEILAHFMKMQEEDGSWQGGFVHGTYDACVAIRILSDNSEPYRQAIKRGAEWAVNVCQQDNGGFSHFGDGKPDEVDACLFHIGTLTMAGLIPHAADV